MMSPVDEKTCSLGTEVAGMLIYRVVTINPEYFQPHQDIPGVEVEGFCCDLAEVSSV